MFWDQGRNKSFRWLQPYEVRKKSKEELQYFSFLIKTAYIERIGASFFCISVSTHEVLIKTALYYSSIPYVIYQIIPSASLHLEKFKHSNFWKMTRTADRCVQVQTHLNTSLSPDALSGVWLCVWEEKPELSWKWEWLRESESRQNCVIRV